VTVPRFAIGRFEVTYADWSACVFDGGCRTVAYFSDTPSRDRLPVSRVTWERAREYAAWLSRQTGQRYRLPTEAEWEYAARAGSTTAYSRGDRIDAHQARFDADEAGLVGQFPPNAWGLHDVHGNVQEWTADCASESYAGLPVDGTAYQPVECHMRIARGGSWQDAEENLRSAARAVLYPVADFGIGIRLVREL
jgi:formylglycine-generating enzyme required for sulfatase activity